MTRIPRQYGAKNFGGAGAAAPGKLKQLQYRSYKYTISIYHYDPLQLSVRGFESMLTRKEHNFVSRLVSSDPIANQPLPEGDDVPDDKIEVAYLPSAFQNRGCALGFRIPIPPNAPLFTEAKIEWLCFTRPVTSIITAISDKNGKYPRLFDWVADLSKGARAKTGTVAGHREHRIWFEALKEARYPKIKLNLTWNDQMRDLRAHLSGLPKERVPSPVRLSGCGDKPKVADGPLTEVWMEDVEFEAGERMEVDEDEYENENEDEDIGGADDEELSRDFGLNGSVIEDEECDAEEHEIHYISSDQSSESSESEEEQKESSIRYANLPLKPSPVGGIWRTSLEGGAYI